MDRAGCFSPLARAAHDNPPLTVVDHGSQVTAVVQDHVGGSTVSEGTDGLFDAPLVLLLSLALPREDGDAAVERGMAEGIGEDCRAGRGRWEG